MCERRVAVVTGSNKGIGFGIVKELCSKFDGVVYLTSRDVGRGKQAVEELNKLGCQPKYHQLDIDDESSVLKLRDYLKETYGGLDVLVNNAATAYHYDTTASFSEQCAMTLRTNFFNTQRLCVIIFPILRPHARVVNVSSSAGHLKKISGNDEASVALRGKLASNDLTHEELIEIMQHFVDAAHETLGEHEKHGWTIPRLEDYPNSTTIIAYRSSKIAVSAMTRIQQREFNKDSRQDLIANSVHPGYVDTDLANHEGPLTVAQGAAAPSWLALLPPNVEGPKGEYIWHDKQIVDWVNGPTPSVR